MYEHTESSGRRANRKQSNKEPGNQNRGHKHIANTTFGLPEVLPRELVSDLDGYEHSGREREYNSSQAKQSRVLLREVQVSSMADGRQQEYEHNGLRWSARDPRRVESVTGSIATAHIEKKTVATESELAEFKNIRQLLSGQHLLNRLSNTHGIDINQYTVKKQKMVRTGLAQVN